MPVQCNLPMTRWMNLTPFPIETSRCRKIQYAEFSETPALTCMFFTFGRQNHHGLESLTGGLCHLSIHFPRLGRLPTGLVRHTLLISDYGQKINLSVLNTDRMVPVCAIIRRRFPDLMVCYIIKRPANSQITHKGY